MPPSAYAVLKKLRIELDNSSVEGKVNEPMTCFANWTGLMMPRLAPADVQFCSSPDHDSPYEHSYRDHPGVRAYIRVLIGAV
jgi:hypothetical protein